MSLEISLRDIKVKIGIAALVLTTGYMFLGRGGCNKSDFETHGTTYDSASGIPGEEFTEVETEDSRLGLIINEQAYTEGKYIGKHDGGRDLDIKFRLESPGLYGVKLEVDGKEVPVNYFKDSKGAYVGHVTLSNFLNPDEVEIFFRARHIDGKQSTTEVVLR
jgi:hypothetical protein